MLAGWSEDELLHEVMVVPRAAFVPLMDTEVVQRPNLRMIITPSCRQGMLNDVSFADLAEAEADGIIDDVIERYRRLGLRFRWSVGPDSRPADLGERLARRGLRASDSRGMARDTGGALDQVEHVTVEDVDETTVDEFTATMAAGWSMDPGPIDTYHRLLLAQPERLHRLFLARYRGEPAGAAGLTTMKRSVYLLGAVVLPAFRGRGLYRALVGARLRYAAARGILLATSQARAETSAPILERMGFETVCRFLVFVDDQPAGAVTDTGIRPADPR